MFGLGLMGFGVGVYLVVYAGFCGFMLVPVVCCGLLLYICYFISSALVLVNYCFGF